jgi:isopentenyl diphosphate isomerase/L-lactate dehydrogenase-like FMN-dependent dehydrogenase
MPFDTGFRRGTDILKALALGANAVGVLSILLIAYAGYGRGGVTDMIRVLAEELRRNMSICGCKRIDGIDPSIVWLPYPDGRRGERSWAVLAFWPWTLGRRGPGASSAWECEWPCT